MTIDYNVLRLLDPFDLIALTMRGEAMTEPVEGQIAVACVIRNRVKAGVYGGLTYTDVILKPKQFSCFNNAKSNKNLIILLSIADGIMRGTFQYASSPTFDQMRFLSRGIKKGVILDNTKGATHYINPKLCNPTWDDNMIVTAEIGQHRFYREKA